LRPDSPQPVYCTELQINVFFAATFRLADCPPNLLELTTIIAVSLTGVKQKKKFSSEIITLKLSELQWAPRGSFVDKTSRLISASGNLLE